MLGLIQRVSSASVVIDHETIGEIDQGLLLLLGIQKHDVMGSAEKLLRKVLSYRMFSDPRGKMNLSLSDINGGLLIVSQFTLAADTNKGLRPSFSSAAPPEQAEDLYNHFVNQATQQHLKVQNGRFGADMQVCLVNDGPVTFMLES